MVNKSSTDFLGGISGAKAGYPMATTAATV